MNPRNKIPAEATGIAPMKLVRFLDEAARQLTVDGKEDEAFYFEQVAEYIRSGKDLSDDARKVATILGL